MRRGPANLEELEEREMVVLLMCVGLAMRSSLSARPAILEVSKYFYFSHPRKKGGLPWF